MMRDEWRDLMDPIQVNMPEYRTWRVESAPDVDIFEGESRSRHDAAEETLYTRFIPAAVNCSRRELLDLARTRAAHGEDFEIISATLRDGERVLRFECWTMDPGAKLGEPELLDGSPPVAFWSGEALEQSNTAWGLRDSRGGEREMPELREICGHPSMSDPDDEGISRRPDCGLVHRIEEMEPEEETKK